MINKIKNIYEDNWKLNNQINRSVKLAINISIISDNYKKNMKFENFLKSNELIAEFFVKYFDNQKVNYKVIFNVDLEKATREIHETILKARL